MVVIKDNFLDPELFVELRDKVFASTIGWYYTDFVANKEDNEHFYFEHWFYNFDGILSDRFDDLLLPVLSKFDCNI